MTTPPPATDRSDTAPVDADDTSSSWRRQLRPWITFLLPLVMIAALVAVTAATGPDETRRATDDPTEAAPAFSLPTTNGDRLSLEQALADGPALLYFSMGVGCYGCFAQVPEIADELDGRGVRLVPIMVDEPALVDRAATRIGVEEPILIDADRQVSSAYGMLGVYGHDDRPSHSFALVSPNRTVLSVQHYAEMFVPADVLLADLGL